MKIIKQNLVLYLGLRHNKINWFKNNLRHREDGPAVIWDGHVINYYLNNHPYNEDSYWKEIRANY